MTDRPRRQYTRLDPTLYAQILDWYALKASEAGKGLPRRARSAVKTRVMAESIGMSEGRLVQIISHYCRPDLGLAPLFEVRRRRSTR